MIVVVVGTQKFQFNRLLKKIDELIENKVIKEKVFAQIGYSDYQPINYDYKDFLEKNDLQKKIEESDLVISHAGTGSLISAIKSQKKTIGIPRLEKYKEHVDNHQLQIIEEFKKLNLIETVYEVDELENAIKKVKKRKYNKYISNTDNIIESINKYIN